MNIITKCESFDLLNPELIDEELLSKVLLVCKNKKGEVFQKACLRALIKLSWSVVASIQKTPAELRCNLRRVLGQVMEFLGGQEGAWGRLVVEDSNYGRH